MCMMNDNNIEKTQRTVRPQTLQREMELPQEDQPMQMQQQQQQAAGKACPYCGAINDPEAMFCAQCGQPISKTTCPHCSAEIDPDADFCEAIDKLKRPLPMVSNVQTVIPLTTSTAVGTYCKNHVDLMSSYEMGKERMTYLAAYPGQKRSKYA